MNRVTLAVLSKYGYKPLKHYVVLGLGVPRRLPFSRPQSLIIRTRPQITCLRARPTCAPQRGKTGSKHYTEVAPNGELR